jgi:hypothetical protein
MLLRPRSSRPFGEGGLTMDRQLFADVKGDYYALPRVLVVDQSEL